MDHGASSYRRYLDGDEEAFDRIVTEYFKPLVSFVDGYVRDTSASEDIAMDVFADLIVYRNRYDPRWAFRTYLYMLGRSRALNYIKHRGILRFEPLKEAWELPDGENSPEEQLLQKEQNEALREALASLKQDQREAVSLVYFQKLSCDDAARVMRKSRKQVYNLLFRAKNNLRSILGEEGANL